MLCYSRGVTLPNNWRDRASARTGWPSVSTLRACEIGRLVCSFSAWQPVHLCNVCLLVGCLTSQQHASVSQGRICSDKCTCCHTEVEVADQAFYLTQSQYTDTGPASPSADPISPGALQGSHWSANFEVAGMTEPGKIPSQVGFESRILPSGGGRLNH